MVILGLILLLLAVFGVARSLLFPLGVLLLIVGVIWDIVAFTGHTITAIF